MFFGSWSGFGGFWTAGGIDYVTSYSYGISQLAVYVAGRRILCHIPQLWNFTALAQRPARNADFSYEGFAYYRKDGRNCAETPTKLAE
jgi:hypothetical protein